MRATPADYGAVMGILREAADWLSARGNPQWQHWYRNFGERMLREGFEHHEVYLDKQTDMDGITYREILRTEISQIWDIDRSEVIENVYHLQHGTLVVRPQYAEVLGWPPGEAEKYTSILLDCFDSGGWFYGVFDEGRLIGAAVLESRFIGGRNDQLQLKFLHVSRSYRGRGLGAKLFELAKMAAHERGATRMYISATPSENTVNFYMRLGCAVAGEPDPELFALEPEDIHLEFEI